MAIPPVSFALHAADPAGFAAALGASLQRYGFAVVADPGLAEGVGERALERAQAFFALPEAVKRRYVAPGRGGQRGFTPFGVETAKGATLHDLKEFWHAGRESPPGGALPAGMAANLWPEADVPGFRAAVLELYAALERLGQALLGAVATHLELAPGFFEAPTRDGDSLLRLLHYPPMDEPVGEAAGHVRAGAHEDIDVITLLLGAEEAGLELRDRDGRWLAVAPPPGAVVCNIGDMLSRLTGGALPSTTHRVVNPAPERRGVARYSTPFFLHFRPDYLITPLPGLGSGPGEPPVTAGDFLRRRLAEIGLVGRGSEPAPTAN